MSHAPRTYFDHTHGLNIERCAECDAEVATDATHFPGCSLAGEVAVAPVPEPVSEAVAPEQEPSPGTFEPVSAPIARPEAPKRKHTKKGR